MSTPAAIGVDVGGTAVKGVVVDSEGEVLAEARRPTPSPDPTGAGVVAAVAAVVDGLAQPHETPTGVVVPGIVDETRGATILSANLGWGELALARSLEQRLERPIAFGHDVRAGALAEARWGAAADASGVVAFVPIGTGVAAALLLGTRPIVSGGWAGEIGQLRLTAGPFAGERVERVASAAGTARRAGMPNALAVVEAVAAGDPDATRVWHETIDVLADALAALTAAAAPELIVVGGGLALAGDALFSPLARGLDERLDLVRRPLLRPAALGDRAAALGAAALAMQRA